MSILVTFMSMINDNKKIVRILYIKYSKKPEISKGFTQ